MKSLTDVPNFKISSVWTREKKIIKNSKLTSYINTKTIVMIYKYTTKGDGGKMESSKEPMVIQNQQKCVCFFLCF